MNPVVEYKTHNSGNHIPFTTQDCAITFNDELTLNLRYYERDEPVHLIIARNRLDMLVIGGEQGGSFVAEILIPARNYETVTADEEGMQALAAAGIDIGTDGEIAAMSAVQMAFDSQKSTDMEYDYEGEILESEAGTVRIAVPLNLGRVTLTLWEVQQ